MTLRGTNFTTGDDVEVVIESARPIEQGRFIALSVLWVLWSLLPSSRPPSRPPRRPYRIVVHGMSDEGGVVLEAGSAKGDEAIELAKAVAADIERIGFRDFEYKTRHGWRID